MFEVEHLRFATPATVSRCGMIWFSDDIISPDMICRNYLSTLSFVPINEDDEISDITNRANSTDSSPLLRTQRVISTILEPFFASDGVVSSALTFAASIEHIMDFTPIRALNTLFSLINKTVCNVVEYNNSHSDFPLSLEATDQYVSKRMLVSIIWAFAGDARLELRAELGLFLRTQTTVELPPMHSSGSLLDYDVQVASIE